MHKINKRFDSWNLMLMGSLQRNLPSLSTVWTDLRNITKVIKCFNPQLKSYQICVSTQRLRHIFGTAAGTASSADFIQITRKM